MVEKKGEEGRLKDGGRAARDGKGREGEGTGEGSEGQEREEGKGRKVEREERK